MKVALLRQVPILLVVCLATGLLYAGGVGMYSIKVPFDFYIGDTKCPAGTYKFNQPSRTVQMTYDSSDAKKNGRLWTSGLPPKAELGLQKKTWLVFNKYGDEYFLSEVWLSSVGSQMPTSKREKELVKSGASAEKHVIEVQVH